MIKSQFVPREDILAILACIHIPKKTFDLENFT